ncbi:bola-like protein [Apiosordaria backusii]|uniref:Bola-like protein n=1 Tax=Apiosordaria backusii TaxID=314023 RepID=A0AA40EXH3_9PEZI|nr:bola-like protein [Apiosordaria backusii]
MICRTCLRARLAQRLSQTASAAPKRTLFAATTRYTPSTTSSVIPACPQQQFPRIAAQAQRLYSSENSTPASQSPETPSANELPKPADLTEGEAQVWDILVAEFAPTQLLVQDISGGCGSMYGIDIASEKFRGLNMLKQQRLVNAALGDLVKEWHGVQLKTRAP